MKRFILTGAPGSGKTVLIRQLELDGFSVVEEAATDLIALKQAQGIAEPWTDPSFIDAVAALQLQRQRHAMVESGEIQFHDRSIICTVALACYLGHPVSDFVNREVERITQDQVFDKRVFFIQNLGFIRATEARRISFQETLRFEHIHEETYRTFGFEIVPIPAATVEQRVATIRRVVQR
jgi:predicted ATPase